MLLVPLSPARPLRPAAGGRARLRARGRAARAQPGHRRAVVGWPPHLRSASSRARVVVRRSPIPVRLARLNQGPFSDRLVRKFSLPVNGWRGPARRGGERQVIEEISIENLGVIGQARLPLGPGFTALTGRDGCGQDHGGHGARPRFWVNARTPRAIRSGSSQAVVEEPLARG